MCPADSSLIVPGDDEETAGFFEGTAAGELRIQACTSCGRRRHPPRPLCPRCHSAGRAWRAVSGRGTIWSVVVPHPPLLPGYAELAPYNVVVVSLEEDATIRLIGNVVPETHGAGPALPGDLDARFGALDPGRIGIGAPVRVVFGERRAAARRVFLPYWVLA